MTAPLCLSLVAQGWGIRWRLDCFMLVRMRSMDSIIRLAVLCSSNLLLAWATTSSNPKMLLSLTSWGKKEPASTKTANLRKMSSSKARNGVQGNQATSSNSTTRTSWNFTSTTQQKPSQSATRPPISRSWPLQSSPALLQSTRSSRAYASAALAWPSAACHDA